MRHQDPYPIFLSPYLALRPTFNYPCVITRRWVRSNTTMQKHAVQSLAPFFERLNPCDCFFAFHCLLPFIFFFHLFSSYLFLLPFSLISRRTELVSSSAGCKFVNGRNGCTAFCVVQQRLRGELVCLPEKAFSCCFCFHRDS
jgi:hypothetical protein